MGKGLFFFLVGWLTKAYFEKDTPQARILAYRRGRGRLPWKYYCQPNFENEHYYCRKMS